MFVNQAVIQTELKQEPSYASTRLQNITGGFSTFAPPSSRQVEVQRSKPSPRARSGCTTLSETDTWSWVNCGAQLKCIADEEFGTFATRLDLCLADCVKACGASANRIPIFGVNKLIYHYVFLYPLDTLDSIKDAGFRKRVQRELREALLAACKAQVIREYRR